MIGLLILLGFFAAFGLMVRRDHRRFKDDNTGGYGPFSREELAERTWADD